MDLEILGFHPHFTDFLAFHYSLISSLSHSKVVAMFIQRKLLVASMTAAC